MANPIFFVSNKHVADSGQPPQIDGDVKGCYHGYFENEYGEQAIFVYDYKARMGTLWMGDAGWDSPAQVVDGGAVDLVLSQAEQLWLQACWEAAIARQ